MIRLIIAVWQDLVAGGPKSGMCDTYILETKEFVTAIFAQGASIVQHFLQGSDFKHNLILFLRLRILGRLVR
jgi:hypothetical protein